MSREIRSLRVFGWGVMAAVGVGRKRVGGGMGRGVQVEGARGAEIASFGIGEVVIGRDRFVVGVRRLAAGLRGFGC